MSYIGTSCIGASSGGSVNQLIALGAMNVYLTQDPTMTFWRTRYDKYTNFVMEPIEQVFNTQVAFGSESQVLLQKTGDLAYFQLLLIELPGITTCESTQAICGIGSTAFPCADPCNPCGDPPEPECVCPVPISIEPEDTTDVLDPLGLVDELDTCTGLTRPWAHWTNAVGQFLPKRVCLVIGGQQIDVLYNDYLFMWEELAGQPGKRLTEMIGKRFTLAQLVADSKRARILYVPLPFWYTLCPGNALALISLQFHGVQLNFCFETLERSVSVSDCNVTVVKCGDCTPLVAGDLRARIETEYVYLDIEERDRFATSSFEQLITQTQALYYCASNVCQARLQLNFNHPIIELIWAVRRQCQDLANNHFNYSGVWGRDPITSVGLLLNNQPRFSTREGRYFRLVTPWEFHTDIPEAFVYCFPFALYPENTEQPSGSCNFSRIDTVNLIFELQPELAAETVMFIVFGRNWNIFRYRQGLGGLAFAS
jgi:hypothetical protein